MGEAKRRQLAGTVNIQPRKVYIKRAEYVFRGKYWYDLKDAETGQLIDSKRHKESCVSYCLTRGWTIVEKPEGNDE